MFRVWAAANLIEPQQLVYPGEQGFSFLYQKLAAAYIKTGQEKEALSTLGKLAGVGGGVFKDTALILEARYYEGLGKPEKGMEKYRELATQFPASPWVSEARSRIDMEEFRKSEKMPNCLYSSLYLCCSMLLPKPFTYLL